MRRSVLDNEFSMELLKKAIDLRFQADHPRMDMDWTTWIKEVREVLHFVPDMLVVLAAYKDRERILGLDKENQK